jgi:3-hydroxypropanoate dehydrogenase
MKEEILNMLFREARSFNKFEERDVSDELLKEVYDLAKYGPTAYNAQPARYIFIKSKEAKERLRPHLMEGNVDKTMKAPVNVIVATDYDFFKIFDKTFPIADIKGMFENNKSLVDDTGFRNGTLSGAYLIMAARSLGLDVGPMSGFFNESLDKEFFNNTNIKSNFLINLGYGIKEDYTRLPRLDFNLAAKII